MNYFTKLLIAAMAFTGLSQPAFAQEQPITLSGDVKLVKVEQVEGGEDKVTLVAPEVIVPGDRLLFTTDYSNSGAEVVTDFVVTNPVPAAVRLAPDADADLSVSVNGGADWGPLAELSVTEEDGNTRPAQHADVTHIRWVLASVQPGETGRLEYPAIIR